MSSVLYNEAKKREDKIVKFLQDAATIPSTSSQEGEVVKFLEKAMKDMGYEEVIIDGMGNLLGRIGNGPRVIAFDGHCDTVDIGDISLWTKCKPYPSEVRDGKVYGRGVTDQKGGLITSIVAIAMLKELNMVPENLTIWVVASVQEEDCDGLCWQYIVNVDGIRPEFVVITEPTDGNIYRGQRGRMEIRVETKGISCHGSAPERGENAVYKMADIIQEVRALNDRLHHDPFLGKGTLAVSEIFYNSPSRCAVADMAAISIDRRLTDGETWEMALEEIRSLPSVKKYNAEVSMYKYDRPSWTDLTYPTECYFPTWVIPEDHPATVAMIESYRGMFGEPVVDKWTFSTNGVSVMGRFGIPCIGFGPGKEAQAHAPNEITWKADLVKCAAVYAALPTLYCENKK